VPRWRGRGWGTRRGLESNLWRARKRPLRYPGLLGDDEEEQAPAPRGDRDMGGADDGARRPDDLLWRWGPGGLDRLGRELRRGGGALLAEVWIVWYSDVMGYAICWSRIRQLL
jgi:hypothetical protein